LTEFKTGLLTAKKDLTTWRDQTNENTRDLVKWGSAISATVAPILAVGTAIYSMQEKYGAMAAQITDLSYTTGLSTDKIQQLQFAAVLSNTAFSSVTTGVNQLTLSIAKAGDVSSDAGKAFTALNISPRGKTYDQVFEDTVSALVSMKDETRRNEIAMTLYGRSWKEMLPFMDDYIKNKTKIQSSPMFSAQELQDLKDAKASLDALSASATIYAGKVVAMGDKELERDLMLIRAYTKAGHLDFKGFYDEVMTYRDKEIQKETNKLQELYGHKDLTGSNEILSEQEKKIELTNEEIEAQKKLKAATDDLISAEQRRADTNKQFSRDLATIDQMDTAAVRNLIVQHKYDIEDENSAISTAKAAIIPEIAAATAPAKSEFIATPYVDPSASNAMAMLRARAGAVQAVPGAATDNAGIKYGDVVVNVDGKTIARIAGVAAGQGSWEDHFAKINRSMGVGLFD
jgi:hypothetical protein